ncbi:MAG: hypothetical protein ACPGLV_18225 [Bacteroidia bacterium]
MALVTFNSYSQDFKVVDSINVEKGRELKVDDLGNIFVVHFDNSIELFTINKNHFKQIKEKKKKLL